MQEASEKVTLAQLRHLETLSSFATSEVLDKFVLLTKGEEGHISREKFEACFKELAVTRALPLTEDGDEQFRVGRRRRRVVPCRPQRPLNMFDGDSDGVVDFADLSSGLSVLCGGTRGERALVAFALYDYRQRRG